VCRPSCQLQSDQRAAYRDNLLYLAQLIELLPMTRGMLRRAFVISLADGSASPDPSSRD